MKTKILFIIFLLVPLFSCSSNEKKYSESEEYQPEILNTDRIIKCYWAIPVDGAKALLGEKTEWHTVEVGNLLISQTGILKAIELKGEKIRWRKIIHFFINDDASMWYDPYSKKSFKYRAKIYYIDPYFPSLYEENGDELEIYWN